MPLSSSSIAHSERAALCSLLEERGPLAPTLCEGWTTADLAAHLYIRERRPVAAAGILVPQLKAMTQSAMDEAKRSLGYEELIRRVASGPPALVRPLDEQMNTVEYFVHHEDVRRAGSADAGPREDPALDAALWRALRRSARLLARKLRGAGLVLVAPGFGSATARSGEPLVTMTAGPQELVLYLFGRGRVAEVQLDGDEAAVARVQAAPFGL
ncbi:MAG TPA: TIGR03085 family metal-binding protein [Acidimicrobiales bacterium]|nr:TIGR03085 family metal-binding protein [Acidimicrobiales bacterium]